MFIISSGRKSRQGHSLPLCMSNISSICLLVGGCMSDRSMISMLGTCIECLCEFDMDDNRDTEEQSQLWHIRNIVREKSPKKTKKAIQIKQHWLSEKEVARIGKSCKQSF